VTEPRHQLGFAASVDRDLAEASDRQGVGGPSELPAAV
jgi:hypothetical protein